MGALRRAAVVAALALPLATAAAPWTVRDAPAGSNALPRALVTNAAGDELVLYRDPQSQVLLQFTPGGAFVTLAPKECPSFQIDQRHPVHHFAVDERCHVEHQRASIQLGQVQNRQLESNVIDQMMNGGQIAFRFRGADGTYHEAEFPLTRSAAAIKRALGTSVRVRAAQ